MFKTTLADGTEIFSGGGGTGDAWLWIFGLPMTLKEAVEVFSNPNKTSKISVFYSESLPTDVFEGYTILTAVMVENGETKVRLEKR